MLSHASRVPVHRIPSSPIANRNVRPLVNMAEGGKVVVVVGSVARRAAEDVVEEMAALAIEERARMTAPVPPAPQIPGRFAYSHLRPLRLRKPLNPVPPTSPVRGVQIAAMTSHTPDEREVYLLEKARALGRRPRSPTPPRASDDHYDLAKWSWRRWK